MFKQVLQETSHQAGSYWGAGAFGKGKTVKGSGRGGKSAAMQAALNGWAPMEADGVAQEIKKTHTLLKKIVGGANETVAQLAAIKKGSDLQTSLKQAASAASELLGSIMPLMQDGCNDEETWAPFKARYTTGRTRAGCSAKLTYTGK